MARSSEFGSLVLRVQAACHSKPMTALQGANRSTEHAALKLPIPIRFEFSVEGDRKCRKVS